MSNRKSEKSPKSPKIFADKWQQKVYDILCDKPSTSDELVTILGKSETVATACAWLELIGEIERDASDRWSVKSR